MNVHEQVDFPTMSEREKYLFDLQGFLVINSWTPKKFRT